MMFKYVALPKKPRAAWDEAVPLVPAINVYEPPDDPVDTGLLDASGVKLYRVREKIKVGF